MGWTFAEFDSTPAHAVYELLEIWRLQAEEEKARHK
jgi:hypothetical protein